MSGDAQQMTRNTRVAAICFGVAIGMVGLAYAAVPLYRMFCQTTGYGGTAQRAAVPSTQVLNKKITVHFDANVAPGLPWDFQPAVNDMDLKIGENALAIYRVTNRSDKPVVGTATFNVTPEQVGAFFNKVQCFCFTEQRLEPGESVDMPVSFYVDPAIVKDFDGARVNVITLSYTFHRVEHPRATTAGRSDPAAGPQINRPQG
jgi:cytochrome c oxidase assembly protein subunit 11